MRHTTLLERFAELGPPGETFSPGFANLFAGIVLGILTSGGGLAILGFLIREIVRAGGQLPFVAEKEPSWVFLAAFSLIAFALIAAGAWLGWWVRATKGTAIHFCPGGLFSASQTRVHWVASWDRARAIRETVMHEHLPIVKSIARHAMPVRTNHSYSLMRDEGTDLVFTGNEIKEIGRFGDLLRETALTRQIPWERVEVRD